MALNVWQLLSSCHSGGKDPAVRTVCVCVNTDLLAFITAWLKNLLPEYGINTAVDWGSLPPGCQHCKYQPLSGGTSSRHARELPPGPRVACCSGGCALSSALPYPLLCLILMGLGLRIRWQKNGLKTIPMNYPSLLRILAACHCWIQKKWLILSSTNF